MSELETNNQTDLHAEDDVLDGDPNARLVFTVGIVGAILMLALLIFGVVLFQNAQVLEDEKKIMTGRPVELMEQQTRQLAAISQYRYISESDGLVAVPIEQAIDLFIARVQADPRQASPVASRPSEGTAPDQPDNVNSVTHPGSTP